MKHAGQVIKDFIERNHIVKRDVAKKVGIKDTYLSQIFNMESIGLEMFEKVCRATGMNPADVFDIPYKSGDYYSDIHAHTTIGDASVRIGQQNAAMQQLLAEKDKLIAEKDKLLEEKERTIKLLMAAANIKIGTEPGQDQ